MVLWEITLATAYFLGLKRTYRLALSIQRRIISPKHSKTRQFVHGRTRAVFDVAVKVHQSIQERDLQVGRNLGNSILRWFDRMKPAAQIRGGTPADGTSSSVRMTKHVAVTSNHKPRAYYRIFRRNSDKPLFTSSTRIWPKPFPTIASMMRPTNSAGTTIHGRHLSICAPEGFSSNHRVNWSGGATRKDIMQWMWQN